MNKKRTGKCLRQVEHIHGHYYNSICDNIEQIVVKCLPLLSQFTLQYLFSASNWYI